MLTTRTAVSVQFQARDRCDASHNNSHVSRCTDQGASKDRTKRETKHHNSLNSTERLGSTSVRRDVRQVSIVGSHDGRKSTEKPVDDRTEQDETVSTWNLVRIRRGNDENDIAARAKLDVSHHVIEC